MREEQDRNDQEVRRARLSGSARARYKIMKRVQQFRPSKWS